MVSTEVVKDNIKVQSIAVEIQKYTLKRSWSKFSPAISIGWHKGKHRRALEALSVTRGASLINYVY
jgi:hypothetical protein